MQKRQLGTGGPTVSAIGLGCMSFAGAYGQTDETTAHRCLDAAVEHGIDFFDTSNVYGMGRSEEMLGRWIATRRPRITLATKGGIINTPTRHFDNSEAHLRAELEGSLRRLNVDHVALYYIHRREAARPVEEVVEVLMKFIAEGKIGGYGLSEVAPATLRRAHAVHPCRAVQSEYSLWTRLPELGLLQACAELGTAFVPFSPLGRGVFTDSYPDRDSFAEGDFRRNNPRFLEPAYAANRARIDGFRAFCRDHGWTVAGTAIAWVLGQGDHLVPIPGTRSIPHLAEWAGASDLPLTAADRAEIARLLPAGFAEGGRYSDAQSVGVESYC